MTDSLHDAIRSLHLQNCVLMVMTTLRTRYRERTNRLREIYSMNDRYISQRPLPLQPLSGIVLPDRTDVVTHELEPQKKENFVSDNGSRERET